MHTATSQSVNPSYKQRSETVWKSQSLLTIPRTDRKGIKLYDISLTHYAMVLLGLAYMLFCRYTCAPYSKVLPTGSNTFAMNYAYISCCLSKHLYWSADYHTFMCHKPACIYHDTLTPSNTSQAWQVHLQKACTWNVMLWEKILNLAGLVRKEMPYPSIRTLKRIYVPKHCTIA